jgi:hypothetical protein
LNRVVEVTATFSMPKKSIPQSDVTASIILYEGFELVGGNTEWKGDFFSGHSYTLQTSIMAIKTGT